MKRSIFWTIFFVITFTLLQFFLSYHFIYIEQSQIFIFDSHYIFSTLSQYGGLATLIADFLLSFYKINFLGALITAALLSIIGVLLSRVLSVIEKKSANLLSLLLTLTFLFVITENNIHYSYIISYIVLLLAINLYISINSPLKRNIFSTLLSLLLLFTVGGAVILFVLTVLIYDLFRNRLGRYSVVMVIVVSITLFVSSRIGYLPQPRWDLLPNQFFTYHDNISFSHYLSWIFLPLVLITSFVTSKLMSKYQKIAIYAIYLPMVLITGLLVYTSDSLKPFLYEEFDAYLRESNWDSIIERYERNMGTNDQSDLYECALNIALAEKGMLADNLFKYDQQGPQSIYIKWARYTMTATLLQELFYSMGHISSAQRMAFEANINANGISNPRMLKRLVETNLIYGSYDVALKYINILGKTLFYRDWAESMRKFIDNPSLVDTDPILGEKRRCVSGENFLAEQNSLDYDLMRIVDNNPNHTTTMQYLSSFILLEKDMIKMENLLSKYYGTKALPKLSKPLQEAILIYSEEREGYSDNFDLESSIQSRFLKFYRVATNPRATEDEVFYSLANEFMDTFWFYAMYKNIQ